MNKYAKHRACRLAAGLLVTGAMTAIGQEAVQELPPIVVTPLRLAQDPVDVPYASYRVSSTDLNRAMPRTSPDALKGIPSVMLQKTAYGQGSPYIRGFTGFRTLMTVDKIRLNNSVFRDGPNQYWNTIDVLSIDRYEVVLGPASVLYGSDAVGGAVHALTATTLDLGKPYGGRAEVRAASADESYQVRLEGSAMPSENIGIRAGVSIKSFGDLEGGKDVGTQEKTGYDELDYDFRADMRPWDDTTLTVAHQSVDQDDAWRSHSTIYGIEWEGLEHGSDLKRALDQDRTLTYARIVRTNIATAVDAVEWTVSRHRQEETEDRIRSSGEQNLQGFDVVTWGADLSIEQDSDAGRWVYGADLYYDEVDSFRRDYNPDGSLKKTRIQGPVADDATYTIAGAFIQDTISFQEDRIQVTPGIRYTYAELDADKVADPESGDAISLSDSWDDVVGSLRFISHLDDAKSLSVIAGISEAFRAPNLSDMTRFDIARSGELETPVLDLDPERYLTSDIGLRGRHDGTGWEVMYYYTMIDDMIVRTPTGRIIDDQVEVTKKNAGDGFVQGVEASISQAIGDEWTVLLRGSWQEGEVDGYPTSDPDQQRDYISRLMPLTGRIAVRYQPVDTDYWLEALVDAAEKADKLSERDIADTQRIPPGGTPGYAVATIRGGFAFGSLDCSLAVENIFDEDYRIHGSGVNEPGRNFVVSVGSTF